MPPPANLQAELDQDEGEPTQIHLTWQYDTDLDGFQGFFIFQNGDTLNENLTQSLSHTQTLYEEGTFIYEVQAMFEDSVFSAMSERKIISNYEYLHFDFPPGTGDPTSETWTILLEEAMLGEAFLSPGDEIAVFYGDKIVGAHKLTIEPSDDSEGAEVVIAFSQLNDGTGYEPGEPFEFEFYDASMDQVYDVYDYGLSDENPNAYVGEVFPEEDEEISYLNIYFESNLPPPQITDIQAEGHTVFLEWGMNSSRNIIGYEVFRDSSKLNDEPITESSYVDENVVSGNYSYQVKALYDEGSSYFSDPEVVTIDVVFFDPEPVDELYNPMTLEILQAEIMKESLDVFDEIGVFKNSGDQEICLAAKSLVEDFSASETLMLPTQNPETGEPGFEEGDSLYFRFYNYDQELEFRDVMIAFPENETDTSGTFNPDGEVNILLEWLPYPPENLNLELDGYDVHLSWNENTENQNYEYEFEGYNVFRNQTQINEELLTSPEFIDSNVVIDDYSYYIQAVYDGISSRPSDTVNTSIADRYFLPVQQETTSGNMQFNITQAAIDGEMLINYDQVGVFVNSGDSLICVGAGSIRDSAALDAPLTFTAYKDNPNTTIKDGFAEDGSDSIYYKFWDESTNNVYQYLDVSFPYDDESGYNFMHFYPDTSCYVNLSYSSPLPVQFSLMAEEGYCTNETGQIAVTAQNFRNISGLDLMLQTDTASYSVDTVIAQQPFLENSVSEINGDTLAIYWENSEANTLENTDTLYLIQFHPHTSAQTEIEWFEESSFSGMNYQTANYSGDAFYIETLPATPSAVIGNDQVCNGSDSSIYSINEIENAQNYIWTIDSDAGSIEEYGNEATVFWNENFEGEATLTVAGENGCGTGDLAEKNIELVNTVYTSITIEASTTESCEGDMITFTASGVNGGNNPTYSWYLNEELQSNNAVYEDDDFQDEDEIYCKLISSSECAVNNPAVSDIITLSIEPLPQQPDTIIYDGQDTFCNTVPVTYYTTTGAYFATDYEWNLTPSDAGDIIGNGNSAHVEWNSSTHGPAYISVRGVNSCGSGPARQISLFRDYCTDIPNNQETNINIFPNPVKNQVYIVFSAFTSQAEYVLSNLQGRIIRQGEIHDREFTLPVKNLSKGLYILEIRHDDNKEYRKILKQ